MFQPFQLGIEGKGLSELIFDTIVKSDINLRHTFFESIVLSGGTTMLPGLSTRIHNDLKDLFLERILKGNKKRLDDVKIVVEDTPELRFLVYRGGAVLANLSAGKSNSWAWRQEYNEAGADAIIRRWQSVNG